LGVKRDYAKAADWYKRAAERGDREGMFRAGDASVQWPRLSPSNREEAVKWARLLRQARQPEGGL